MASALSVVSTNQLFNFHDVQFFHPAGSNPSASRTPNVCRKHEFAYESACPSSSLRFDFVPLSNYLNEGVRGVKLSMNDDLVYARQILVLNCSFGQCYAVPGDLLQRSMLSRLEQEV